MEKIRRFLNPDLVVMGLLRTMFDAPRRPFCAGFAGAGKSFFLKWYLKLSFPAIFD